jgi:hypothetical protein
MRFFHTNVVALLVAGVAATASAQLPNGPFPFRATARDIKTGKVLFVEQHRESWRNGQIESSEIVYSAPDGRPIAKKIVSFLKSRFVPDFRLEDFRDGYLEGGRSEGGSLFKLFVRVKTAERLKEKLLSVKGNVIADAGFDPFVRENWVRLLAGEKIKVAMGIPFNLDTIDMALQKVEETTFGKRKAVRLRMAVDNFLLRSILDPIELVYDAETRRCLLFKGITAINDERGKSYKAELVYDYEAATNPGGSGK